MIHFSCAKWPKSQQITCHQLIVCITALVPTVTDELIRNYTILCSESQLVQLWEIESISSVLA